MSTIVLDSRVFDLSPKSIMKAAKKKIKDKTKRADTIEYTEDEVVDKPKKKKKKSSKKISYTKVKSDKTAKTNKINKDESQTEQDRIKATIQATAQAEKARLQREEEIRQAEIDVIQLIARRDFLNGQLASLNPYKSKDSAKIVNINIELADIETALADIRNKYGISTNSVKQGSKFTRFVSTVKTKASSIFGKVKKFFKKNSEVILGVASIVVPFVGSLVATLIINR